MHGITKQNSSVLKFHVMGVDYSFYGRYLRFNCGEMSFANSYLEATVFAVICYLHKEGSLTPVWTSELDEDKKAEILGQALRVNEGQLTKIPVVTFATIVSNLYALGIVKAGRSPQQHKTKDIIFVQELEEYAHAFN